MLNKSKIRVLLALLLSVALLTSCLNSAAQSPTPDVNMVYTQAAQTLVFQLTGTAAAMPTATFTPAPTNTTAPTATLSGTLPPLGTISPLITLPSVATATLSAVKSPDSAIWVEQTPADGTLIGAGTKFDIAWKLKNTGTTTWTNKYYYRYYAGAKLHENTSSYFLKSTVSPEGEVILYADMIAPMTSGEYSTTWVITNEAGINFYSFTLTIKVGNSTAAPTVNPDKYCCINGDYDDDKIVNDPICKKWYENGNTCPVP